tara:strand:- start:308 stop:493 length:186 start_codon:yes stop_codon:yes gene_type:complete
MKKNKIHLLIDQIELRSIEKKLPPPKMKLIDKIFIALGWVLAIPHLIKAGILYIWNKILKK